MLVKFKTAFFPRHLDFCQSESDQAVRAVHSCNTCGLGLLWSDLVIKLVSALFGKCTTLVATNADQWKPDYHMVSNEKLRT